MAELNHQRERSQGKGLLGTSPDEVGDTALQLSLSRDTSTGGGEVQLLHIDEIDKLRAQLQRYVMDEKQFEE